MAATTATTVVKAKKAATVMELEGAKAAEFLGGKGVVVPKTAAMQKGIEIEGLKMTAGKGAAGKGAATAAGTNAASASTTAAKSVGGTIWTGKGLSLGLGLGLGAWGPVILLGLGAAAVYGYMKTRDVSDEAVA